MIDISILKKNPVLNTKVILEIEPLTPLSMVSELPGSYYKTLKLPDSKMICGLIENLLGWHIDLADRNVIAKEMRELRKKMAKKNDVVEFRDRTKGSTYCPLLMDYFEIKDIKPVFSKVLFYDDLWSKSYRRSDSADTHMGGSSNLSYGIIAKIHYMKDKISELSDKIKVEKDKETKKEYERQKTDVISEINNFFKQNIGCFPLFYSTPTKREYIEIKGVYKIGIEMDNKLYTLIKERIMTNNICYLGTSEGWVNLNILNYDS
jgi:CRISPR-associated protein Cas5